MRWSLKIGRFAGINTYVHATFLLLVGWAAWGAYRGAGTALAVALGVGFLLAVFGSVLLHEFGHALVARRYGIQTRKIVLSPIGGLAQLEGMPSKPLQEMAVALAGPVVNFALAGVLWVVVAVTPRPFLYGFAESLMWANLTLGLFNLVPAFPMDGGRALRAALSVKIGDYPATVWAAYIGKAVAFGMAIVGFFANWTLVAIGAFVWFAAGQEVKAARHDLLYEAGQYPPERASVWERVRDRFFGPRVTDSRHWRQAKSRRWDLGRPARNGLAGRRRIVFATHHEVFVSPRE